MVNPPIRWEQARWQSLDGTWQFAKDPELVGEKEGWYRPGTDLPDATEIQTPAAWETQGIAEPGMSHVDSRRIVFEPTPRMLRSKYQGAAWYKRTISVPSAWEGKQVWLKVGGINSQGWLYLNGKFAGHTWAYCGTYKYNVTDLVNAGADNVIAVLARNDLQSRRGQSNCVAQYGGIFRSMELEATEGVLIEDVYVTPRVAQRVAHVSVALRQAVAVGNGNFEIEATVRSLGQGGQGPAEEVATGRLPLDAADAGPTDYRTIDIPLKQCTLWSPENPHLYAVEVVLKQDGRVLHGWVERFGMKQWEVRGGDFYLNGRRYYLRGAGDDHVYPLTVCSPASREMHREHLAKAKAYGFNFVRHHTHCEIPEFFQVADELGILVQGELPYWAPASHMSLGPIDQKKDLRELVRHYRRYTSLVQYCGGNEGNYGPVLGPELYQLAKALDPTRPFLSQDGGINDRSNSDFNTHGGDQHHVPGQDPTWPFVKHEYMSLGLDEDPRIHHKYKNGYVPSLTLERTKQYVENDVGLDWSWADACYTAGHKIQGVYHKIGIETARLDPNLDGTICWLMIDISPNSQNGVLDMFWQRKHSTPEYFQQFNGPTTILARHPQPPEGATLAGIPETPVYTSGDVLAIDWVVSNFARAPIEGDRLVWQLEVAGEVLSEGAVEQVDAPTGAVQTVGHSEIVMPEVAQGVKAQLKVRLTRGKVNNSWDLWIFPPWQPRSLNQVAATAGVYDLLAKRYKDVQPFQGRADEAKLIIAEHFLEPDVLDALENGAAVIALQLPGIDPIAPGHRLGWWGTSDQTGTVVADHAAFGQFPHEGWMQQVFWRLIGNAEKLEAGHRFKSVEPLMLGIGRSQFIWGNVDNARLLPGFNLSVFQARVGQGRLLCSGLKLQNDNPEAVYLLDQFIKYGLSEEFAPNVTFELGDLKELAEQRKAQIKVRALILKEFNGFATPVSAAATAKQYASFLGPADIYVARQTDGKSAVVWRTKPVKAEDIVENRCTLAWAAATGWQTDPAGGHFALYLGGKEILRFDLAMESKQFQSSDGQAVLDYEVKGFTREDKQDSCGIMRLRVPAHWVKPGEPVELKAVGSAAGSNRFFGVYDLGD